MFFLDTNILVYGWDESDLAKQTTSRKLIRQAIEGKGLIAPHILGEFASVLLHRMKPAVRAGDVLTALDSLAGIGVVAASAAIVRRATEAHATYGVHFYDGLLIASAERASCSRIYTEDLSHGQHYFGVEVINPFRS